MARSPLLLVASLGLVFALACGGGEEVPLQPDVAYLDSLPRAWTEVTAVQGGGWKLTNGCVNGDLMVGRSPDRLDSGGCGGPVSDLTPTSDGFTAKLLDDNSGSTETVTFRWVDRAAGVGEWMWTGCLLQPVAHMEYDKASLLPPDPNGCAGP